MDPSLEPLLAGLDRLSDEFREVRDGVKKAVRIADEDPEMALTRARKVLELVVREVYQRRLQEPPGTRPLENLIQRLVKDGFFPDRLDAYATTVRKLGNVGTHTFGETITRADVHLSLLQLAPILAWYFQAERPDAMGEPPAPPPSPARPAGERPPGGDRDIGLPAAAVPPDAPPAGRQEAPLLTNSIGMKLVLIPRGRLTMGSPSREAGRYDNEGPRHEVEISRAFYLGLCPVTQADYARVMDYNPSWFAPTGRGADKVAGLSTARFPVEMVSWDDAVAFCEALTRRDTNKPAGWVHGLPTEAEWEYACRAGTQTACSFGDDLERLTEYAWFVTNAASRTHEVGTRKPNPWGLFDMHGNVWEWCADWYDKDYYRNSPLKDPKGPENGDGRVLRGGSWNGNSRNCRSANRGRVAPAGRFNRVGFRVVLRPA